MSLDIVVFQYFMSMGSCGEPQSTKYFTIYRYLSTFEEQEPQQQQQQQQQQQSQVK
jgi:hypothetical protein